MSRRLVVSGGSRPVELVLVGTLIIGRDPACDISETNDPLMSRRHAAFSAGPREATVRDLGSRNGILVNGVKITESALRSGDVVQIGHVQVRYVDEVGPYNEVPLAADAAVTKPLPPMIHEPDERISQADTIRMSDAAATKKIT